MSIETLKKELVELKSEINAWQKVNPILWKKAYLKHNEVEAQIKSLEKVDVIPKKEVEDNIIERIFKPKGKHR
jgi:uncharacterized protein YdcH (DUF465 family)